jgi:NADPH-dependent 2,4-dienoyl-CoA reductase/sulfur reductase-like enzyme
MVPFLGVLPYLWRKDRLRAEIKLEAPGSISRESSIIAPGFLASDFSTQGGEMTDYDLVVIGAGTAGKNAAKAAARLGAKPALVEVDGYGGTCLATG